MIYINLPYNTGEKGIQSINENTQSIDEQGIKFGVVVTLKEINEVNRIDKFIDLCSLRGRLVNKVNVENQIDIYNEAEGDI